MSADFGKMREIFLAAVECYKPEQWPAHLDQACAGDEKLRRSVEMLLKAYMEDGPPLDPAATGENAASSFQAFAVGPAMALGPYQLLGQIGEGGMGEVYRARDTRLGREVAVKVLPEAFANDPDRQARFEREARAVAALSHPNILAIHDYGTQGAVTHAVMELLEGETLRDRLTHGPLPWKEAVEIGAAIADGLTAAHGKGIVHRDLKPENLFLTTDGRVKILDFGLARVEPVLTCRNETSPYLPASTDPGIVMGTVGYMSPEQVRGQQADAPSDVFSFGCVLYELLTGKRAFQRETAAETMTAILHDEPQELANLEKQFAPGVGRIIRQCLAKSPIQRFQSARDLALALRATASDPNLQKPPLTGRPLSYVAGVSAALLLIGAIAAGVFFLIRDAQHTGAGRPSKEKTPIEALAVLPFENVGGDPDAEFLSDGIAESIIKGLYEIRRLKVRPFTSVSRYKGRGKDLDLEEVGKQLNVQAVLTGKLTQRKEALSLSLELVDVQDLSGIWFGQYDCKRTDIQTMQEDVSRQVCAKLGLQLTDEEQKLLTRQHVTSTEAHLLYVKGRHFWNKRTREGLEKAIEYFQKATDIDPNYAGAWAGLADCYNFLGYGNYRSPKDSFPKGEAAATKASALDPTLADPHASLGFVRMYWDWDFPAAEKEFRQAIKLNPNLATAHHLYSLYLTAMQRHDEAKKAIERAQEIDPLSVPITTDRGFELHYAGRNEEAIDQLRAALEMDPRFPLAHFWLGRVYTHLGQYKQALEEFEAVGPALRQWQPTLAAKGYLFGIWDKRKEAREVLDEFQSLRKGGHYATSYGVALVYSALGDKEEAFAWLDSAIEERSHWLVWLALDPRWDCLRANDRFRRLLQRVGLADNRATQNHNSP
jgi:serine/threonine protein kinase/TolB-like protein/Tfp pilus assembly protein PilF